jgi:aryl-alcohol dehydrogenase-like predicted oxidoreductase
MAFGGDAYEAESARMYALAREAGVDFVDTANVYTGGRSEEIVVRLIAEERDAIVLTSKGFGRVGDGPNERGLSRRHIVRAVEASLKRLGTDRLDFNFVHQFDHDTPRPSTWSGSACVSSTHRTARPAPSRSASARTGTLRPGSSRRR